MNRWSGRWRPPISMIRAKLRDAVQTITLFALRAVGVLDARARGLVVQAVMPVMPARDVEVGDLASADTRDVQDAARCVLSLELFKTGETCLIRQKDRGAARTRRPEVF